MGKKLDAINFVGFSMNLARTQQKTHSTMLQPEEFKRKPWRNISIPMKLKKITHGD